MPYLVPRATRVRASGLLAPAVPAFALSLCFALHLDPAHAAGDLDAAVRQADRLQNQQREQIDRQRQQDLNADGPATRLQVQPRAPSGRASTTCRDIHTISVSGVTLLRTGEVEALLDPYRGRCLGVAEIEGILGALTNAYIDKGYVAARAYLPAQDLSTGSLLIQIEEGRLKSLVLDDGQRDSVWLPGVAPGLVDNPLNLRDLEQALDQINRLRSNNATMDIRPGAAAGDSVVTFHNDPGRRVHLGLTYDNYGQKATGRNQVGANLALDNPFGLNDYISVTHRRAQPYDTGRHSSYLSNLSYVLPLGYSTLSLNASESEYASILRAPSGAGLHTNGNSKNYSVRLDHVLWRGQQSMWTVSGSLTKKKNENYLEGILLEVSSRSLTVFDLDTSFTTQVLGGALNLDLGVARGLPWFDALKDASDLPGWAPRAQFTTYKYGFGFYRPFQLAGENFSLNSTFTGQWAANVLYGSEQMSIGSPFTVRGFAENPLSGDHGYYLRNDLSWTRSVALIAGQTFVLRPYLGADYGRVRNRVSDTQDGELSSVSAGVGAYLGPLSLDLLVAHPIGAPSFMKHEARGDSTFFNLSLAF
ncbi:MAG: Hemolysin transporter protein ShlB [Pseudomonas citronellolis]|nr:MAG: Hemolysin transporter protein ShlB [Pseudomonas citronellolis]